jgi:hypothetical protein
LTRVFSCSNPSETRFLRWLREHLLCDHSAVEGCASSVFFSSISAFLGAISGSLATRCSGAAGRVAGRLKWEDFLGEMAAALGSDWEFWWLLAECGLKAWFFPYYCRGVKITSGVGKSYCSEVQESLLRIFRSRGVIWWIVQIKYSINHFFRVS